MARTLLVFLAALVALAAPATAAGLPDGFQRVTLVPGLTQPTAVAFVPDGRMLILEKPGRLKVAAPGAAAAQTIYSFENRVNEFHDRGALGLAVDSDFAHNPYVYVVYTYDVNPLMPDSSGRMVSQLIRLTLAADDTVSDETVLAGSSTSGPCPAPSNTVDCIPSDSDSHSIGTVRSAPDGTLFFGSGDSSEYGGADPQALRTYDEQTMSGKIMHVDRNGSGLPGHPFCPADNDLTHVCAKLWAKGFRNPFRFSLRPDGGLAIADVGWNTTEEIDLATAGGGRSYGWPCIEGHQPAPVYSEWPECQGLPPQTPPDIHWPHDDNGGAAIAGPTYSGTHYPGEYGGALFYGDYGQGWLNWREPNGTDHRFRDNYFGVVDVEADLDGDLVMAEVGDFGDGSGEISAIRYTAGNQPPIARILTDRTSGPAPLAVAFDGTTSEDPESDPLTYAWDFGDGATSTDPAPTHQFAMGTWPVQLTVDDGHGHTATVQTVINSGNTAPVATITAPATYRDGATVTLHGAASDEQDGALGPASLSWRVVLHHNAHVHVEQDLAGSDPSFTARSDHDADSFYVITLTARDSSGLTGSTTARVDPETVPLSITSDPAGAPITWGGTARTTPFAQPAAIGFVTDVSTAAAFDAGGRHYVFDHWSDGGARTHAVAVPDSALALVATYLQTGSPAPTATATATSSPTASPTIGPTVTPGPTETPTPAPEDPLVASYSFDEPRGRFARDDSPQQAKARIRGARRVARGKTGRALRFDGTDNVVAPATSALQLGNHMTLSAWIKPARLTRTRTVVGKGDEYALLTRRGSTAGRTGDADVLGTSALRRARWTHVALTYDGTTLQLFVNGRRGGTRRVPGAGRLGVGPLTIGDDFAGLIDEVRLYATALSGAQIRAGMK